MLAPFFDVQKLQLIKDVRTNCFSSFSCLAVSDASLEVKVCEIKAIFEIINVTDSLTKYY